ncbi:MAG: GGDEF domain-containing protein [Eubacteriaceae bacterium]|nr:GGDEF domain-containing protein [Eubacteriaceae bacterium]
MNNEKIQHSKLDIILEKKQGLDAIIQDYETRIDEKLASLAEDEIISKEINPELFETSIQDTSRPDEHFLSGVDISDDDALDQAVLNSRILPSGGNQLAFNRDELIDEKIKVDNNTKDKPHLFEEDEDEELPTLSKILGRDPAIPNKIEVLPIETPEVLTSIPISISPLDPSNLPSNKPPDLSDLLADVSTSTEDHFQKDLPLEPKPEKINKTKTETLPLQKGDQPLYPKEIPSKPIKPQTPAAKVNLVNMVLPLVFFIAGLLAFGVFLILFSQDFSFVDYSVLFILFTCLIFTIAMPYGASIFFMALLFCSYIALTLISIFYLEVPFELYQIGWVIVIPLILWSSALLIKKVRELFKTKKLLEGQIASYDQLDEGSGLTIEKAYYKDLKYAMDRATKGETILVLEMMSISHLETLKSITGPRLWDEILYKTLNIIKQNCFSTHLIYVLEGNVFSIIMENTSMKNQFMINHGINEAFNAMILEYNAIDVHVELHIIAVPYSREITNPFEYRALGLRQLKN